MLASHQPGIARWQSRIVKDLSGTPRFEFATDLYNPRVSEALRSAVFDFCEATLETALTDAATAYAGLRGELIAGMEAGELNRELARRVQGVFLDPARAARIAVTESSRATHAGQLELARETGIVKGKKWLASSDCCDLCASLAAMGEIDLDAPFMVHAKGRRAYAVVMAPPAHVNCQCAMTEVVDYAAVQSGALDPGILQFGARVPSRASREAVGMPRAA